MFYGQHILLRTYKPFEPLSARRLTSNPNHVFWKTLLGPDQIAKYILHTKLAVTILTSKKKILSLTFGQAVAVAAAATQRGSAMAASAGRRAYH